jgi:hypothetical protein
MFIARIGQNKPSSVRSDMSGVRHMSLLTELASYIAAMIYKHLGS